LKISELEAYQLISSSDLAYSTKKQLYARLNVISKDKPCKDIQLELFRDKISLMDLGLIGYELIRWSYYW